MVMTRSRLEEVKPALVLLDVMMPGRDGWQVCRQMKRHPTLGRNVRVVMVTALDDWVNRGRHFRRRADDFVEKPFGCRLVATVERNMKQIARARPARPPQPVPLSVDYHQLLRDSLTRLPTVAQRRQHSEGVRTGARSSFSTSTTGTPVEEVYGWGKLDSVLRPPVKDARSEQERVASSKLMVSFPNDDDLFSSCRRMILSGHGCGD
jgi:CheY-like chemotaxis protein